MRALLSTPSSMKLLSTDRAPLATKAPPAPARSPPAASSTPVARRASCRKFRPLSGRSLIVLPVTTCPTDEVSDASTGRPVTRISSVTSPVSSLKSTLTSWSVSSTRPSRITVRKPGSSQRTVYVPEGRNGTLYCPVALVTATRASLVLTLTTLTVTPGTTPWVESVTVPSICAVWACARVEQSRNAAAAASGRNKAMVVTGSSLDGLSGAPHLAPGLQLHPWPDCRAGRPGWSARGSSSPGRSRQGDGLGCAVGKVPRPRS